MHFIFKVGEKSGKSLFGKGFLLLFKSWFQEIHFKFSSLLRDHISNLIRNDADFSKIDKKTAFMETGKNQGRLTGVQYAFSEALWPSYDLNWPF